MRISKEKTNEVVAGFQENSELEDRTEDGMNLDEALAVWLYMQHSRKQTPEEMRAFAEASKVICAEAVKVIKRMSQ